MNIYEKLTFVQSELKAPKGQYNTFGKYNYRSCEDILEGLKPLLLKYKLAMFLTDEIIDKNNRFYVKSTIKLINIEKTEEFITVDSYAREEENKKGMDGSQVTGASSSYSRKYALNGLFAIDDTKDSDFTSGLNKEENKSENKSTVKKEEDKTTENNYISENQIKRMFVLAKGLTKEKVLEIIKKYGYESSKNIKKTDYNKICEEIEANKNDKQ